MKKEIVRILRIAKVNDNPLSDTADKILSLLDENTEVVSSAAAQSSVYTDVRGSHASGDTEQPEALVEGALEKITSDRKMIFLRGFLAGVRVSKGYNHKVNINETIRVVESEWKKYLESE